MDLVTNKRFVKRTWETAFTLINNKMFPDRMELDEDSKKAASDTVGKIWTPTINLFIWKALKEILRKEETGEFSWEIPEDKFDKEKFSFSEKKIGGDSQDIMNATFKDIDWSLVQFDESPIGDQLVKMSNDLAFHLFHFNHSSSNETINNLVEAMYNNFVEVSKEAVFSVQKERFSDMPLTYIQGLTRVIQKFGENEDKGVSNEEMVSLVSDYHYSSVELDTDTVFEDINWMMKIMEDERDFFVTTFKNELEQQAFAQMPLTDSERELGYDFWKDKI